MPGALGRAGLRRRLAAAALLTLDVSALAVGAAVAAAIADEPLTVWLMAAAALLSLAGMIHGGLYARHPGRSLGSELALAVAATALAWMLVMVAVVVDQGDRATASHFVIGWIASAALVILGRVVAATARRRANRRPDRMKPTLIVGADRVGRLVARRLAATPQLGLRPVAFIDKQRSVAEPSGRGPIVVCVHDIDWLLDELQISHAVVAYPRLAPPDVLGLVRKLWHQGVTVDVIPRLFELHGRGSAAMQLGAVPLLPLAQPDPPAPALVVKHLLDRVIASLALVLMAPVMAAIAVAIRVTMGSPVLFRQERVGRDGQPFQMLKFRSMQGIPEVDGEADAAWAARLLNVDHADAAARHPSPAPRTTRLGEWLRATSLDELPQLINVLGGEMSLVGPRPERVQYVRRFEPAVYRYADRHRMKAGITGWAQVNGLRGETSLADRVEWDNFYIEHWSLLLDLQILLRTIGLMLPIRRRLGARDPSDSAAAADRTA